VTKRVWPAERAAAVDAFVRAWWQDVLTTPEPPYSIDVIFETCASIARTVTPFLDAWGRGPVADAHLARCADVWLYDMIADSSPFQWWCDGSEDTAVADLRAWLAEHGAARLRDHGQSDLAIRADLLALPYDERWAHPYWNSPSSTN